MDPAAVCLTDGLVTIIVNAACIVAAGSASVPPLPVCTIVSHEVGKTTPSEIAAKKHAATRVNIHVLCFVVADIVSTSKLRRKRVRGGHSEGTSKEKRVQALGRLGHAGTERVTMMCCSP